MPQFPKPFLVKARSVWRVQLHRKQFNSAATATATPRSSASTSRSAGLPRFGRRRSLV
jgi:hypothetical protein